MPLPPLSLASGVNAPTVILALLILAAFVAIVVRGVRRRKQGGGCSCGGNCGCCSGACHHAVSTKDNK